MGGEYASKLYRMFEFVLHAIKPDRKMPQVGDNDSGRFLLFGMEDLADMGYLLALGSVFFREKKFKIEEFGFCGEVLWVFGKDGYEAWNGPGENHLANITGRGFPDAGWYIMRNDKSYMIVSAGPNGQNGNGGHSHNDKLGFELAFKGDSIIIDPGTYLYTPLPERRNEFRSTSYHNTAVVDGKEQNEFKPGRLFVLEDKTKVSVKSWKTTERYDFLEAEHYGYQRLDEPIIHRRLFIFDKVESFWVIKDIFSGKGRHDFSIFFNFEQRIESVDKDSSMAVT
ncbi:MAG: heparinase II/III-family protein, partial [Actinobacteria bacterium]|nr:heparinase II/III-family protein [Actinomycetota bacterium]